MARGCHQLIRQGAKLVESAADVLSELAPMIQGDLAGLKTLLSQSSGREAKKPPRTKSSSVNPAEMQPPIDEETQKFLDLMGYDPVNIDRLVDLTGMPIAQLSGQLLTLELDGLVDKISGARYQRRV